MKEPGAPPGRARRHRGHANPDPIWPSQVLTASKSVTRNPWARSGDGSALQPVQGFRTSARIGFNQPLGVCQANLRTSSSGP